MYNLEIVFKVHPKPQSRGKGYAQYMIMVSKVSRMRGAVIDVSTSLSGALVQLFLFLRRFHRKECLKTDFEYEFPALAPRERCVQQIITVCVEVLVYDLGLLFCFT